MSSRSLCTPFRSELLAIAVSASSTINVGSHFAIERKRAGPLIETLGSERRARNPITPSSVVLPLFASAEVASSKGLWVALSCTQVHIVHKAGTIARFPRVATYRLM